VDRCPQTWTVANSPLRLSGADLPVLGADESECRCGLIRADLVAAATLRSVERLVGPVYQVPRGVLGQGLGQADARSLTARHDVQQAGDNGPCLVKVTVG